MFLEENRSSLQVPGTTPEPEVESEDRTNASGTLVLPPGTTPEAEVESKNSETSSSDPGEVGNLLESMEPISPVALGAMLRGKVLKITDSEVLVDIGLKSEAAVPRSEFVTEDGQLTIGPDDAVDIWIESYDETTGTVSVSHRKAAHLRAWEEIERAFQDEKTLTGRVVGRIKGGLTVDIGVRAFLPGSQADRRPHCNLDALLDHEITCKVLKINRKRNNVVVSRKLALEEEYNQRKAALLEQLVEGAELMGRVKNLTDYGAFVDLGGLDGLLHITDLSWGRVRHPSEVVQAGQEIKVKVLKYDREKERVSLGLKQLSPDPWERLPSTYRPGDRVSRPVVSITDYGAFVELEPGVEGLIHISEMDWGKRPRHPSKIVTIGDRVEVAVLDVNAAQRRISLSLKQTLPDPWTAAAARLSVGSVVKGRVRNLTEFGAFVEIEPGVDGLIHLSDLSWTKNVKHPSEVLKKGEQVQAAILSLDLGKRRMALGLKQLQPDIWEEFFSKAPVGAIVKGKVTRLASFGAFVELQEGIEGLCHISEFDADHAGDGRARLEVGGELDFRVIRLDPAKKKIGLSMKKDTAPPSAQTETAKPTETSSTMAEALSAAGVTAVGSSSSSRGTEA